jgi:hypothetical protein
MINLENHHTSLIEMSVFCMGLFLEGLVLFQASGEGLGKYPMQIRERDYYI